MKFSAAVCLLLLFACGCNSNNVAADLLSEQKLLKDSTGHIVEKLGDYMHRGRYDSAEAAKLQLGAVQARLIKIQSAIDSLENAR